MTDRIKFVMMAVIDAVPQWYIGKKQRDNHAYSFECFGVKLSFFCHRKLTPELRALFEFAQANLPRWINNLPSVLTKSAYKKIQDELVLFWLRKSYLFVHWEKLLDYIEELKLRTYENRPVILNLLLSDQESNTLDLSEAKHQKLFDPLASSLNVYLQTDGELNLIGYKQVSLRETKQPKDYKLFPDFLQAFNSVLSIEAEKLPKGVFLKQVFLHLTTQRDILIQDVEGLLAAFRKGNWFIYDARTFKNCIGDVLDDYWKGCHFFDIIFDLSYRRHGALLVYDPNHQVVKHVVNKEAIISQSENLYSDAREYLGLFIREIKVSADEYEERKKRLFLEIAAIDGAVIFDKNQVLAFGAMIETHPEAGGCVGARTTAAKSALLWGGKPIKISADGHVSILFMDDSNDSSFSELSFM